MTSQIVAAHGSAGGRTAVRESVRLGAIDVGSNSLHMIVAQADPDGRVTTLWRMKEMVGLGRTSFPSQRLSAQSMNKAIAVLAKFQQAAQQRQVEKLVAVATSAVREAENGGDFLERARRKLGLYIRLITAREEARLIYLGVRHAVPLKNKPHLIIDIGGGSVEFIVGDDKNVFLLDSCKLGAARMTATYIKSDPPSESEMKALTEHYDRVLTPICQRIMELNPVGAIGTSGTLENLAAMCAVDEERDEDASPAILRGPFEDLHKSLLASRSKDRANFRGLDEQRRDQIVAGAMLVDQLFRRLKLKRLQICSSALREGILLDYLTRHIPDLTVRREIPDPRRRSVIDLARRCNWHRTHSEKVADLTLQLFDELKSLHGLGASERDLIEYAALLHDIGWHISRKRHHKHGMYLVLHGGLKSFSDTEIQVMANIVRYHRKSPPKPTHDSYAALSPRARRIVNVGAALLRVTDGLDRSHCSVVDQVRCRLAPKAIKCRVTTRADAQLEIWGATRKCDLLETVFKRDIIFEPARR